MFVCAAPLALSSEGEGYQLERVVRPVVRQTLGSSIFFRVTLHWPHHFPFSLHRWGSPAPLKPGARKPRVAGRSITIRNFRR